MLFLLALPKDLLSENEVLLQHLDDRVASRSIRDGLRRIKVRIHTLREDEVVRERELIAIHAEAGHRSPSSLLHILLLLLEVGEDRLDCSLLVRLDHEDRVIVIDNRCADALIVGVVSTDLGARGSEDLVEHLRVSDLLERSNRGGHWNREEALELEGEE